MSIPNLQTVRRALRYLPVIVAAAAMQLTAQSLVVSRHADYSTQDTEFTFDDTLFAKVTAPQLDFTDLDKNEYRLKPDSTGVDEDIEGEFDNHLDGTYTAVIPLAPLDRSTSAWEFRAELEDDDGNKFNSRVELTIADSMVVTVTLQGRITAIGADHFDITNNRIFVDGSTQILDEFNNTLPFDSLEIDWKVSTTAEQRSQQFWAVIVRVLQRSSGGIEVETKGPIANLADSTMTVNFIDFQITPATVLQDDDGNPATLADFAVGMEVQAKGVTDAVGEVLATEIKIEDANTGGQQIDFTGQVELVFSQPPLPDSIQVDGQLLEVDAQTILLGFESEPIQLADFRIGEVVEVSAVTRSNALALAQRIKREDSGDSDVEIKGAITNLGDSSLTVSGLTFQVRPATVFLDDENIFITLVDLRAGLIVEVKGDRLMDGSLAANRVKIEDDAADEVEISGFLQTKNDSAIEVASQSFLLLPSTKVFDEEGSEVSIASLSLGARVTVKAERRFNGSLIAREIRVLDFLGDEIELIGELEAILDGNLTVARIDLNVDENTTVIDTGGADLTLADLLVQSIVQIRARFDESIWYAKRIRVLPGFEEDLTLAGRIQSLATDRFTMLGTTVRLIERSQVQDVAGNVIPISQLAPGQTVEVIASQLSDSSYLAKRVRLTDSPSEQAAIMASLDSLTASSLFIDNLTWQTDAATVFLGPEGELISPDDLYRNAVIAITGTSAEDSALRADSVQISSYRIITGTVTSIESPRLEIQQLGQELTAETLVLDEQNRVIAVDELKQEQQVRVVAALEDGEWQAHALRILFRVPSTGIDDRSQPQGSPASFTLAPSYPNPFVRSRAHQLTIPFVLPAPATVRIEVFNVLGQSVATLLEGRRPPGRYQVVWDGRNRAGVRVPAGVYFYRLLSGRHRLVQKLTIVD